MIFHFKDELTSQAIGNRQRQHFKPRTKVSLQKGPSLTLVTIQCFMWSRKTTSPSFTLFSCDSWNISLFKGTLGEMQLSQCHLLDSYLLTTGNYNPPINFCGLLLDKTDHVIHNRTMVIRRYPSSDLISIVWFYFDGRKTKRRETVQAKLLIGQGKHLKTSHRNFKGWLTILLWINGIFASRPTVQFSDSL